VVSVAAHAQPAAGQADDRAILLQRLQQLEQRLNQIESRAGMPATPPAAATGAPLDTQAILERLDAIDQRLNNLETNVVLSEPKTIVREVERYVDPNGVEYDQPAAGRRPVLTYERQRVFRRQSIGEEIEDALAAEGASGVEIGVSSVTTVQGAFKTSGPDQEANGHVFGVTQADVTFLAQSAALNTSFFADLVAIGGPGPDGEIPGLTLLNSQLARLSNNRLQTREAWIRTELFGQRLGVTVGQVDLTNYFDRNAVANDETFAFISDALVNNQVLGLANNGLGLAAIWDPKSNYSIKLGVQQSEDDPENPVATSLSNSLFSMAEFEYIATPFGLPEGHYRIWGRLDNSTGQDRTGWGVSIDQKITPTATLFGRYGNGDVGGTRVHFFSGGVGFQAPFAINPLDAWGIGYAQTEIVNGPNQKLAEAFYNLYLTDALRLSFMLQYVHDTSVGATYILPGTRFAVSF
jgi:Carbohydrate-selective porin, OprB family